MFYRILQTLRSSWRSIVVRKSINILLFAKKKYQIFKILSFIIRFALILKNFHFYIVLQVLRINIPISSISNTIAVTIRSDFKINTKGLEVAKEFVAGVRSRIVLIIDTNRKAIGLFNFAGYRKQIFKLYQASSNTSTLILLSYRPLNLQLILLSLVAVNQRIKNTLKLLKSNSLI